MCNLKLKVVEGWKDRDAFGGGLLFYVNEKLNCRSLEIYLFNATIKILPLEFRLLNSKWLLVTLNEHAPLKKIKI